MSARHWNDRNDATATELRYRLFRGSLHNPNAIPHWSDLEQWMRDVLAFMYEESVPANPQADPASASPATGYK